jgi:hypothetical protein
MPTLVTAVETELSTDFAILNARQAEQELETIPSFAASAPGVVGLECGTKYSRVRIRAERWDERPPLVEGWEDSDELPFEEVPGAGDLELSGFDPSGVGLDITGFGRGRVQVFGRGRHRYSYSEHPDIEKLDPEEWLLRFYPAAGAADPMAGGPRRIAGAGGLSAPTGSPWLAAVLGFRSAGWSSTLLGSRGFDLAYTAIATAGAPVSRLALAKLMAKRMPPWELGGDDAESRELPPRPAQSAPDVLARLSGFGTIATFGDAIDALVALGLLLTEHRSGERVLVPNPSPRPAWEKLLLTGEPLVRARAQALENDHRRIAGLIASAIDWCGGDALTATPRAMAIRWATTVDDVVGGLRMLGGSGRIASDGELGFDSEFDPDVELVLRKR